MARIQVQLFSLILVSYFGSVISSELGSACTRDIQCKVDNSHCSSGVCTCKHYYAQLNTTACLESKLLGRECIVSEQCFLRVANSTCKDGHCHCSQGFVRFRKHTCLKPAKVGDVCYSDEHCRLWAKNSHCRFLIPKLFGKCVCDGEGNCAPEEPPKPYTDSSIATEDSGANGTATTEISAEINEGERPVGTLENTFENNSKPEEMNAPFVDPFWHQKEHLQESVPPSGTESPTEKTAEKSTEKEHLTTDATDSETTRETTEGLGSEDITELPTEGSKYRVEVSEKETDGSGAAWSDVDAVSLGYPCRSDAECQKRDGGSLCLDGVCDCAVKTNASGACGRDSTGCGPETFQCRDSGLCISWFFVCDGRNDCPDNSDEECEGPECPRPSFKCGANGPCVSLAAICDGVKNCPDAEDERSCSPRERNATRDCPQDSFRCADGQCLPKFEFCNAIPKCGDGSDEFPHLCSSHAGKKVLGRRREYCPFECGNGRCRSTAIVCSGRDGCGDNSDEAHCSVCRCPAIPAAN